MHTIRSCRTSASTDTRWSAQRPDVAGQIENGPERHLPARRLIVVHLVSCTTVGSRISRRVSRMMEQLRKLFINKHEQCEENRKNIFFTAEMEREFIEEFFFNLTSILQTFRLKIYIYFYISFRFDIFLFEKFIFIRVNYTFTVSNIDIVESNTLQIFIIIIPYSHFHKPSKRKRIEHSRIFKKKKKRNVQKFSTLTS